MLVDIGVNLTDKRFDRDRRDALERARAAGVVRQVLTGTDESSSDAALTLARQHADLYCTAGVHPHMARTFDQAVSTRIQQLIRDDKVCAVGETGLDFNRDFSPRPQQEAAFEQQLALAADCGKPVFLHQRDAHERFLPILRTHRDSLAGAVVHCFTGSRDELFDYLDLGCHIGITGWLCDERRGGPLREIVADIPAERLMVETDSPWLIPRDLPEKPPVKGRNEPALLPWIVRRLAECRGEAPQALTRTTFENSLAFFQLPGD
jgi:TatD DNase family protein